MRWSLCALLLLICPVTALAAPTITITVPAADPNDLAYSNSQQVRGTFTGVAPITIEVNGVAVPPADVNLTTHVFTANGVVLVEDPNAPNTVTAAITADDGTASDTIHIIYDTTEPVVNITGFVPALLDPNTTPFRSVHVLGTATDPNSTGIETLTVRGVVGTLEDDGTFDERTELPGVGTNVVIVRATDKAGNFATDQVEVTRTIVCQDPNFPLTDPNATVTTYVIDRNDDLADPVPTDDICDVRPDLRPDPDPNDPNVPFAPPTGHCTLRAAIQTANHHPGDDRILLNNRTIVLTRIGGGEDLAARGDLDVTENLRILGGGRDSAIIDARKLGDRIFDVQPGAELQLLRLSVANGKTPKPSDPNSAESGGCLRSRGSLKMNNAAVLNCKSDAAGGGISIEDGSAALTCAIVARGLAKTDGGGISAGDVAFTLRNSTLSLNAAGRRGGAISMVGGEDPLDLVLSNDTVSQNKAKVAGGALSLGASITAKINSCTFANNVAKAGATISATDNGTAEISNSILGDKSKVECDPNSPEPVVSMGGNVDRGESCNLSEPSDLENTDPKLAKLQTNQGPPTHRLLTNSPAIDHAGTGEVPCEPLDARDTERRDWPPTGPSSGETASPPFCDSGAFELEAPLPN